jgi:hypothetical protein
LEDNMRSFKRLILISILAFILIPLISCGGSSPAATSPAASINPQPALPSPTPSSPAPVITQTTPKPLATITPEPPITVPTPTTVVIPITPSPSPDPSQDKSFFIDRVVSGYNKIPKPDGSFNQVPIFQDVYLNLNILGYYTKKDAYFVPRIPTVSDHDDWFIRLKLPGYLTKSWVVNWSYTVNKSSPAAEKANISATLYTQEIFDANYYLHPGLLLNYDLRGDRGPSSNGIYGKYISNPGSFVLLLRTNDASAISDFGVKLGTEGNIATPAP